MNITKLCMCMDVLLNVKCYWLKPCMLVHVSTGDTMVSFDNSTDTLHHFNKFCKPNKVVITKEVTRLHGISYPDIQCVPIT